ncbi:hypothetical protein BGZ65_002601, partial [Modicella reniformis]
MATAQSSEAKTKPEVIIVGAGLAGLLLGQLLEQIGVPYHIFERAAVVKPLGSAMTLGPSILPVFEQLGLFDELQKISVPCYSTDYYNDQLEKLGSIDLAGHKELLGYNNVIFARPKLYDLMLSRVPAHRISHEKKILHTEERQGRVLIHCVDGTSYAGDILVGADGAYSTVRQDLYKRLLDGDGDVDVVTAADAHDDDDEGDDDDVVVGEDIDRHLRSSSSISGHHHSLVPESDLKDFEIGFAVMVGVAEPENLEEYPQLKDPFCHFSSVVEGSGCRA